MRTLILIFLFSHLPLLWGDQQQSYQESLHWGHQAHEQALAIINTMQPQDLPGFATDDPKETTWPANRLSQWGQAHASTDEFAQSVYRYFYLGRQYQFSPNDPILKRAEQIEQSIDSIVLGVEGEQTTCREVPECERFDETLECDEPAFSGMTTCEAKLHLAPMEHHAFDETVVVHLEEAHLDLGHFFRHKTAHIRINAPLSQITQRQNLQNQLRIHPKLNRLKTHCPYVKVRYLGLEFACEGDCGFDEQQLSQAMVVGVRDLSCEDDLDLVIHWQPRHGWGVFRGYHKKITTWRFRFQITSAPPPTFEERWINQCQVMDALSQSGHCKKNEMAQCVAGRETRTIHGVEITRDCWKKQYRYQCGQTGHNTCQALRDQSCEQIGSTCVKEFEGVCVQYQQTMQCPTQSCDPRKIRIVCDRKAPFCADGHCTDLFDASNHVEDFKKSVSTFNAVAEGGKAFDGQQGILFTGRDKRCSLKPLGVSNCCAEEGWGQGWLTRCRDEEKQLAREKETNQCIEVGKYCAKREPISGACLEYKKSYCCFDSALSKIVQEQGRSVQLGIDFGSAEQPVCRGISPQEMQRLDFSRMNFEDFYETLMERVNVPNQEAVGQRMRQRIEDFYRSSRDD